MKQTPKETEKAYSYLPGVKDLCPILAQLSVPKETFDTPECEKQWRANNPKMALWMDAENLLAAIYSDGSEIIDSEKQIFDIFKFKATEIGVRKPKDSECYTVNIDVDQLAEHITAPLRKIIEDAAAEQSIAVCNSR